MAAMIMKALFIGVAMLAGTLGLSAAEAPSRNYYELRIYDVTRDKLGGVLERFRDTIEPVRRRHGINTVGYWTTDTTGGDKFIYLMAAADAEELKKQEKEFGADVQFKEGYAASNQKHGKTVDRIVSLPLNVDSTARFDFTASPTPRVFDLRIYSVLPGKLDAFRNRWRDFAVPIYERHGLHSLAWWVAEKQDTEGRDHFVVLLAGQNLNAIQRSVDAFHHDPEWQRIEKETERDGKLRGGIEAFKLKPADFSLLK